jgi:hypothetical protein
MKEEPDRMISALRLRLFPFASRFINLPIGR